MKLPLVQHIPLASLAILTCAILLGMLPQDAHAEYDTAAALAALPYLELPAGPVEAELRSQGITLGNAALSMHWQMFSHRLENSYITNKLDGKTLRLGNELFILRLEDGRLLGSSDFQLAGAPVIESVQKDEQSPRLASRLNGKRIRALMVNHDEELQLEFLATLLADTNYIRQEIRILPGSELDLAEILWFSGTDAKLQPGGRVDGSPALCGNIFLGIEHPLANNLAAVPPQQVAAWTPAMMSWPEQVQREWELGNAIKRDGAWQLRFQYTAGGYRIEVTQASLTQDGRVLARDEHFGASGIAHIDNDYNFDVAGYDPQGGPVTLQATVRADGGTDSTGVILLSDLEEKAVLRCTQPVGIRLSPGRPYSLSAVCGVAPEGQMRRAFQRYIELERAHPFRQFLHYNSWYDIGYFSKYSEQDCLDIIRAYTDELVDKRGVQLDSFLFDDGWDDYDSLWDFHDGFPEGFSNVAAATEAIGAGTGVWLSPWGGYGEPREQRIAASRDQGYEINEGGFALSGPKYYARFREICLEMITAYNANQFKLDGLGRNTSSAPGSAFNSDFDAAIALIDDMRQARSDVFVNLTTGTWPSPFWLRNVDSIYRGGWDHSHSGVGSDRQQWISYRDSETFRNIASGNPLYPLNSLMLHGIIYAKHAGKLATDPDNELRSEIRSYFGSGTALQEMYISPELMTDANWDDLAASASWARQHARALCDSHWVGGDPVLGNVYGWAGWTVDDAVLTLRNPSEQTQSVRLAGLELFELEGLAQPLPELISPYADQRIQSLSADEQGLYSVELLPFEVLVFSSI